MIQNNNTIRGRKGFTLVEILVVLVIALVVLSIAVPRIRIINNERNYREAARVVGSAFANAGQRAKIDGVAGVRLTRNPNFVQGGFQFAASEVSLLRGVPGYTGDTTTAEVANTDDDYLIDIDMPLEQASLNLVQAGDTISFNNSSGIYRITGVTPGQDELGNLDPLKLRLQIENGGPTLDPLVYLPAPPDDASFVINRSPRVLRSSTAELPQNYIIDLRFSGFEVQDAPAGPAGFLTVFNPAFPTADIEFVFDEEGAINRVIYRDPVNNAPLATSIPLGPAFLFVTQAPDSVEVTEPVASVDDLSLWVAVSSVSGTTNIGYNNSASSVGQTYATMTDLFNNDRVAFNALIQSARDSTLSSSASQ